MDTAHSPGGTWSTAQAPIWELPDKQERLEGLDASGRPDPAYAAALGLKAPLLRIRALAAAIDVALFVVLQVPFLVLGLPLVNRWISGRISGYGFVNHPDFVPAMVGTGTTVGLTLALFVTQLATQGRAGFTLGKLVTGLRVVNVETLARPGIWRVTLRALVLWGSIVTVVGPVLFLASPWFDRRGRTRGWHDRVGRTWVVDRRHGLNPYDEKRMRIARKLVASTPVLPAPILPSLATTDDARETHGYRLGERSSAGVLGIPRSGAPVRSGAEGHTRPGVLDPSRDTTGRDAAAPEPSRDLRPPDPATSDRTGPMGLHAPAVAASPAPAAGPLPPTVGRHRDADHPTRPDVVEGVAASAPRRTGFTLMLDSGSLIGVPRAIVLGRAPEAVEGAEPVPVADPSMSISKTHLLLRPVDAGVEVVDQGSTNGTAVLSGGRAHPLTPGEVALALPGDTIRFGDRTGRVMSI